MQAKYILLLLSSFIPLLITAQTQPKEDTGESYDFGNLSDAELNGRPPVSPFPDPYATLSMAIDRLPQPINLDDTRRSMGYPPMAKEAEIEGEVILRILVDKQGHYMQHIVLKDPHPILTKGVIDKLRQLVCTPAIQDGKPVMWWITIRFDFNLLSDFPTWAISRNLDQDQWIYDALGNVLPFNQPQSLTEFTLSGQELQQFPWRMLAFTNLQKLDVSHNHISIVPAEIAGLKKLETLNLSHNNLQSLPNELLKMPSIKSLIVDGNRFPIALQQKLEEDYGAILFPKDNAGKVIW